MFRKIIELSSTVENPSVIIDREVIDNYNEIFERWCGEKGKEYENRTLIERARLYDDDIPLLTELVRGIDSGFYFTGIPDDTWITKKVMDGNTVVAVRVNRDSSACSSDFYHINIFSEDKFFGVKIHTDPCYPFFPSFDIETIHFTDGVLGNGVYVMNLSDTGESNNLSFFGSGCDGERSKVNCKMPSLIRQDSVLDIIQLFNMLYREDLESIIDLNLSNDSSELSEYFYDSSKKDKHSVKVKKVVR